MMISALVALVFASGSQAAVQPSTLLAFNRTPQELSDHCKQAKARAEMRLSELASLSPASRTLANTPVALDDILWDLSEETASDAFLKEVSVSSATRDAATECATDLGQFMVDVFAREDLFKAFEQFTAKKVALTGEDARLVDKQALDFKRSGMALPKDKREKVKALRRRLVQLETDFGKNLNEVKDTVAFTRAELDGLPDDFIAHLPREGELYRVSVDYPDYFPFMANAKNPEARKKLETVFDNRAYKENEPILKEVLKLRQEAAELLGYKNHAEYVLEDRMAKTPEKVQSFITRLVEQLKPLGRKELQAMVALKDKELGPKSDHQIHLWDWRYYDNQQMKERAVDKEELKDFFPLDLVTRGMMAVYEKLLGVKFTQVKDAAPGAVWHPDAQLFAITEASGGEPIAYFYLDLFPRDGKYKHAAAFDLIHGRRLPDGSYQKPVAAMVANFTKPAAGKPSLLKPGEHDEVETYFHEFGHIMHQTLTTARHARFSGSNTARDFVEAPSQMLENWVWDGAIIDSMSGRYDDPSKKLPKDVLQRMIDVKELNVGLKSLRQLLFASVDMDYHTHKDVADPTAVWNKYAREVMLVPQTEGTHPEASFGHLMGYDAGYYGYMWSEVYAQDMFSLFEREGLLSPVIGRRYRDEILAPGGSREESESLRRFLGREPNEKAFLKSIGLGS